MIEKESLGYGVFLYLLSMFLKLVNNDILQKDLMELYPME